MPRKLEIDPCISNLLQVKWLVIHHKYRVSEIYSLKYFRDAFSLSVAEALRISVVTTGQVKTIIY